MRALRNLSVIVHLPLPLLLAVVASTTVSIAQTIPADRHCRLGLAYVTANRQVISANTAYQRISEAADIAYIQGSWPEWESGIFDSDIRIARSKGLKIYLALDFLGYLPVARATIALPPSLGGDTATFVTAGVADAYANFVKQLVRTYTPDYLVPIVEINLHKGPRPASYQRYVQLYPQLYLDVKALSPATLVAPSIVLSDQVSPSGFGQEDKDAFKAFLADFEADADINAVSMYPFSMFLTPTADPLVFNFRPAAIPDTFLSELAGFSRNPLFISENSWVSHGFTVPVGSLSLTFNATPQDQRDYVLRMAVLAANAYQRGKRIEAVNFVSLIDPTPEAIALFIQTAPSLEWFCYLGLMDGTGVEKPALAALRLWKQTPYVSALSPVVRRAVPGPATISVHGAGVTIRNLRVGTPVCIFSSDGRLVRELRAGPSREVTWDHTNSLGAVVGKGPYVVQASGLTRPSIVVCLPSR